MTKKKDWGKLPVGFKKKWVEALRGGVYKQNVMNGLKTPIYHKVTDKIIGYKHCCLSVAGDIVGCKIKADDMGYLTYKEGSVEGVSKVPKMLRGDSENSLAHALAQMNDSGNWSFKRIATWIEKNL